MVPMAISQAVNVRVGFHLGAQAPTAARRAGMVSFMLGITFMLVAAAVFLIFPRDLALLFNLDPAVPADAEVIALVVGLLAVGAAFPAIPVEFSVSLVFISMAVSILTGIISGFAPAWGASRLDPVVALRYE
jgi:Na+-driven multidrug efflux pump